jgi:hypothetical protein
MEIKVVIDDRIVDLVRRVFRRRVLAATAGVVTLVSGIGVVYGVGTLNTFTAGTTISASQVNANFSTLKTAVQALEDAPSPFAGCTTNYNDGCGPATACYATCPSGQHPISGGCDTTGGGVVMESYPEGPTGAFIDNGTVADLGRWVCKTDAGTIWSFVICCDL